MYSENIERLKEVLKLRNYSSRTVKAYSFHIKRFFDFTNLNPKFVRSKQVEQYIAFMQANKESAATINLAISAIKFYYDNVMRRKLFYSIKRLKQEKKMVYCLACEEVLTMINSCSCLKHRLLIALLYSSGLRVSEAINLTHTDLDIGRKLVFVKSGKGKKDRASILSSRFVTEYNSYMAMLKNTDKEGLVFRGARGKYSIKTIQAIVKQAAKNAGIKQRVYPHILRKSFATHLLQQGTPLIKIQKLLGHADISTTTGYLNKSCIGISDVKSPLDGLDAERFK